MAREQVIPDVCSSPVGEVIGIMPAQNYSVVEEETAYTNAALALLMGTQNEKNKPLIDYLLGLIARERRVSNIPPKRLEVTVHVDSETDKPLLHIKQTVAANAEKALAYWDRLSLPIDQWIQKLPEEQKEFVLNDVYITVHWTN